MNSAIAIGVVLLAVFGASILVERAFGRSRKEFRKPGWFFVFFGLFIPGIAVVYSSFSPDNPLIYAAYGLAGGLAALIAQCFYGIKLPLSPAEPKP